MINDTYQNRTKYYFGKDTESHITAEIPADTRTLLHYGKKSLKTSGLYDTIVQILNERHIPFVELGGVEPNPKSKLIYEGIDLCKHRNISYVLAAGGGSVIDSAKAICAGAAYEGDFADFYLKKQKPERALPLGVVLTHAGSGSESNNSSVVTFDSQHRKVGMDYVAPEFVIMNPANTLSVSVHSTCCGIFDAISHILERYFTPTPHVDFSSGIAESLIRTLMNCADRVRTEPDNYNLRAEIMWSCRLAMDKGIFLGRKGDWSCHQISHVIGAYIDATHAEILSVVYPAWLALASGTNDALMRRFDENVLKTGDLTKIANKFRKILRSWGLPVTFSELNNASRLDLEKIADDCAAINPSGTLGNFRRLTKFDILKILQSAI